MEVTPKPNEVQLFCRIVAVVLPTFYIDEKIRTGVDHNVNEFSLNGTETQRIQGNLINH